MAEGSGRRSKQYYLLYLVMRRPETSATEYYFTISFVTLRSPSASFTIWNDGMEAVVPLYVPSYTSSGDFEASPLMKNCRR